LLGKGRFGKVYQCRKKDTGHIYAIKVGFVCSVCLLFVSSSPRCFQALLKTHIESSEAQKILVEREKAILMKIKGFSGLFCGCVFPI
jgi:hypothetical protein